MEEQWVFNISLATVYANSVFSYGKTLRNIFITETRISEKVSTDIASALVNVKEPFIFMIWITTNNKYRIYSKERCGALLFLGVSDAALNWGSRFIGGGAL